MTPNWLVEAEDEARGTLETGRASVTHELQVSPPAASRQAPPVAPVLLAVPAWPRRKLAAVGALVLAVGAGWLAYRRGYWWIAAVPLGVAVIAGFVIVATGRPLEVTPVPFALVVAIGAMGGLWARSRHASP